MSVTPNMNNNQTSDNKNAVNKTTSKQRKQPKSVAAKGFRAKRGDDPRNRLHQRIEHDVEVRNNKSKTKLSSTKDAKATEITKTSGL